jgi:CubicO group peptidase (beta-lactamase class C family)
MAAAGLWTTPSDLARVILEIQNPGQVLQRETVKAMLTSVGDDYGLGFALGETRGATSFSHGGANAGFRCMLFAYRDLRRGAVVMTNSDRGAILASEVLRSIASEYGWPDYQPEEMKIARVSDSVLASYAGKYRFPDFVIRVTASDGRLWADAGQGAKVELLPESKTAFFNPDGMTPPVQFRTGRDGSVEMSLGGLTAKRQ